MPMAFFGSRRVGELTSRVSTDIAQLEGALIDALPQMCRQTVFLLGGITMIGITSGKLTLVMLCTLPVLIAAAIFFGKRLRRFSRETQDRLAETNTIVEETFQAIASVKAFANEDFEIKRYGASNSNVLAAAFNTARWRAVFVAFFIIALFGGIVIVLWFGAGQLQSGEITAGELTRFVLYTTFVAGAMGQSAELLARSRRRLAPASVCASSCGSLSRRALIPGSPSTGPTCLPVCGERSLSSRWCSAIPRGRRCPSSAI